MSEPLVLTIPEDIAEDARNTAKTLGRDAAEMLIEHLAAREFRKPAIFPNEVEEQALMQQLSDGAVWAIAREHMGKKVAQRMRSLMRKNSLGKISPQEHQELETLVEAGQQSMLRKSQAMAILMARGYQISVEDLAPDA
jgi:hypothetical protein